MTKTEKDKLAALKKKLARVHAALEKFEADGRVSRKYLPPKMKLAA